MIDLTNAPEGATHYRKHAFYKRDGDSWMVLINKKWSLTSLNRYELERDLVSIQCKWSIYNNDKPLSELSDEQVGAIFRYGIENGVIEVRDDNGKWWDNLSLFGWHTALAYRAKQKSERELFVKSAMKFCIGGKRAEDTFSDMFNAGFKAPKVSRDTACSDSKVSKVK